MSTVYVRWYGQVLQGEVMENKEEGLLAGMVAVRIQIQGMHATALFTPEHVYDSPEQIAENSSINSPKLAKVSQNPQEISQNQQILANNVSVYQTVDTCIRLQRIENFKAENWNHERNHLRTDKLDEFYQLWRTVMRPSSYVEAETVPQNRTPPVIQSQPKPVSSPPSKKVLRSTGKQPFNDSTQLSIFD